MHHHFKKDAPSGTAVDLARRICEGRNWDYDEVVNHGRSGITGARPERQIGIHALRGGDVVGEHRVSFFGDGERVELKHLATDRKILAQGRITSYNVCYTKLLRIVWSGNYSIGMNLLFYLTKRTAET